MKYFKIFIQNGEEKKDSDNEQGTCSCFVGSVSLPHL